MRCLMATKERNNKGVLMKKLMMFAAAMTIVGGAYAQTTCVPSATVVPCDETPVWDFTFKGKASGQVAKGYKSVYSISYKGWIVGNVNDTAIGGTPQTTVTTGLSTNLSPTIAAIVTTNDAALLTALAAGYDLVTTNAASTFVSNVQAPLVLPTITVPETKVDFTTTVTLGGTYTVTNTVAGGPVVTVDYTVATVTAYELWLKTTSSTIIVGGTSACCLTDIDVVIYDKASKRYFISPTQPVDKMSVFGKDFTKLLNPGKSVTLESDVKFQFTDPVDVDTGADWLSINNANPGVVLDFVGFGKGKKYMTKDTPGTACSPGTTGCEEMYDWPSWSGWFTGWYGDDSDEQSDFTCACVDAVAGGTWSAKYNKKMSASGNYPWN